MDYFTRDMSIYNIRQTKKNHSKPKQALEIIQKLGHQLNHTNILITTGDLLHI